MFYGRVAIIFRSHYIRNGASDMMAKPENARKNAKTLEKRPKTYEKRSKIDRPKTGRKNARGFGLPHGALSLSL